MADFHRSAERRPGRLECMSQGSQRRSSSSRTTRHHFLTHVPGDDTISVLIWVLILTRSTFLLTWVYCAGTLRISRKEGLDIIIFQSGGMEEAHPTSTFPTPLGLGFCRVDQLPQEYGERITQWSSSGVNVFSESISCRKVSIE